MTLSRRSFLALAGWSGLLPAVRRLSMLSSLSPIGLQLYTVRDLMAASVPRTLELVAQIGYTEVEFAGYFGARPAELRRWLGDLGLRAPAAHVDLLYGNRAEIFDAAVEVGHRFIILASLPLLQQRLLSAFHRVARELNRAGEQALRRGLSVAYHNHAFEFARRRGDVPYDVLLRETDPELVSMEVDLYWMAKGGGDVLAYFERFPGRFRLCHLKDMDARGDFADVGAGILPFKRVLAQRREAGLQHFFVEHDRPRDPLASVRASYRYLQQLSI